MARRSTAPPHALMKHAGPDLLAPPCPPGTPPGTPEVEPVDLALSPDEALAAWPDDLPLAAVRSCAQSWPAQGFSRPVGAGWTIIAAPSRTLRCETQRGRARWSCLDPRTGESIGPAIDAAADPLAPFAAAVRSTAHRNDAPTLPFVGGWIGLISYEFGSLIEPAARPPAVQTHDRRWPLTEWHRCPAAYLHDGFSDRWWRVGPAEALPSPELLRTPRHRPRPHRLGPVASRTGQATYEAAVARAIEFIRAGDIFQANLAHRLSGAFEGSARSLFGALAAAGRPRHGAYVETAPWPDGARRIVASASPELFLAYDPATREAVTRPMKGTRPAGADPAELRDAPKDRAELNMIVDLMRNDLGRVCRFGTVRVPEPRVIETHESVLQAVATVRGELRDGLTVADLLRAAFAPGSVTGAPKIRAMQIIGELEPVPRGPYCGAIGFLSDGGHAALNVAIRTALLTGRPGPHALDDLADALLDYSVGAGIVADSDPAAEWRETLDKAALLGAAADHPTPRPPR